MDEIYVSSKMPTCSGCIKRQIEDSQGDACQVLLLAGDMDSQLHLQAATQIALPLVSWECTLP